MEFAPLRRNGLRRQSDPNDALRQTASESVADAKFAIQESGNWIKNADTKSTVVAAATGVVAAASASNADAVRRAFESGKLGNASAFLVVLIIVYVGSLFVTVIHLYLALSPRTEATGGSNRFAWTSVASGAVAQIPESSWSSIQSEAWQQNSVLCRIAGVKYRAFKSALKWFGANLFAAILITCVSTWATAGPSPTPSGPTPPPQPPTSTSEVAPGAGGNGAGAP